MFFKSLKKVLSSISIASLLWGQILFPSLAFAQEATPSAIVEPSPSNQPNSTPTPSPSPQPTPSPTPAPSPSHQQEATPSAVIPPQSTATASAQIDDGPVVLGQTYHAPQNDKVSVTFTKLPDNPGTLAIKEVTLTDEQVKQTGALSNIAYDITSTMEDGTFEYTLTLPTPTTRHVEVKASEDGQTFVTLGGVSPGDGILTVTNLNHFTVFVVTGTISGTPAAATPFDESQASVVINEFVYNAATEWVEIYNKSANALDISGWTLVDLANNVKNIPAGAVIPAKGFYVYETSNWLNNTGTETINLKNGSTLVDRVSYKDGTVVGAQDIGNVAVGKSVARTTDGGANWAVDTTPSKGWSNALAAPTTVYVDASYSGIKTGTQNQPFTAIQQGVDAVAPGGTVIVAPGIYNEIDITVGTRLE